MSVRNSKALIGALFIQYCAYGVFYIMDEFKKMTPPLTYGEIENQEDAEPAEEAPSKIGKLKKFFSQRAITEPEKEEYRKWEAGRLQASISNEIVEYYPRMMMFHTIAVAICAIRSPTDVTVVLTYFSIILRLLMLFGWYCQKRQCVYLAAGAGEALINLILFGIAMAYQTY